MEMRHVRLRAFRRTGLSALGVIGSCLGVYAVLAVAFHALVEPSLGKSYAANEALPSGRPLRRPWPVRLQLRRRPVRRSPLRRYRLALQAELPAPRLPILGR